MAMDPEFMTRYLDQQNADREDDKAREGEPVSEPDVGKTPSVDEPGAQVNRHRPPDEPTAIVPADVLATLRSQAPRSVSATPPQAGTRPDLPPPPPGVSPVDSVPADAPTTVGPRPSAPEAAPDREIEGITLPLAETNRAAAGKPAAPAPGGSTASNRPAGASPESSPAPKPGQPAPPAATEPGRFTPPATATPAATPSAHRIEQPLSPPRQPDAATAAPPPPRRLEAPGEVRGAQSAPPRPPNQQWNAPTARPQQWGPPGPQQQWGAAQTDAHWGNTSGVTDSAPWAPNAAAPHLRSEQLVKARKLPPEMGWRKAVYKGTGHLINLGAGPAERKLREQIATIRSNIPGNYSIGVVSIKGGVGKTRTTAGLGTVYATYRTEPVIALDANPTYGGLGRFIDESATSSIREFMSDDEVVTYPKARSYTGKNKQGLEVLAGNQNIQNSLVLSEDLFNATLNRSRRFYQLSLVDCGNHIDHRVMKAVLHAVDALVIVTTSTYEGAESAEKTINWLAARNFHDLLRRSALVLNDVHRSQTKEYEAKVREHFESRVGAIKTVPWDKHLRDDAVLDFDGLDRDTQLAYIDLAAWLAQGFPAARAGVR